MISCSCMYNTRIYPIIYIYVYADGFLSGDEKGRRWGLNVVIAVVLTAFVLLPTDKQPKKAGVV